MSARSSARNLLALAAALAACSGSKAAKLPEADPAKVTALAKTMLKNVPLPASVPNCKYEELTGHATLTMKTLYDIAQAPPDKRPEFSDYVNPTELDLPAARQFVEASDETVRRQAAAEFLLAPSFLVYHIDLIDTPLALGVKDFKRGNVGARALKYDKAGSIQCAYVFLWTNDPAKQAWAVEKTDKALVPPEVKDAMQKDLRAQMLVRVAALAAPPPKHVGPVDDRSERN